MELMHTASYEGKAHSFYAFSESAILPEPTPVHQPKSSLNTILLGFHGGFITQARWIKSLTIGDWFSLQPLFPRRRSERRDWKLKLSNHMVGSPGKQPPSSGVVQKSPL